MHLYMNFQQGEISGEGTDYVGPWVITGTYDVSNRVCQWEKQYLGKHRVVYEGKITENGIQGVWNIRNWNNGPFHIWPRLRTDLYQMYMQQELENQSEPSIMLDFPRDRS